MPKRFTNAQRRLNYERIKERNVKAGLGVKYDGEICGICGKPREKGSRRFDIEHRDGNPQNNDPSNLQLAHRSCNQAKENKRRPEAKGASRNGEGPEREDSGQGVEQLPNFARLAREGSSSLTRMTAFLLRHGLNADSTPTALLANKMYVPRFRLWVLATMYSKPWPRRTELLLDATEFSGCSTQVAEHYLDPMTAKNTGCLFQGKDPGAITPKDSWIMGAKRSCDCLGGKGVKEQLTELLAQFDFDEETLKIIREWMGDEKYFEVAPAAEGAGGEE